MKVCNFRFFTILITFICITSIYMSNPTCLFAADAKKKPKKEGEKKAPKPIDPKEEYEITNDYVHSWISFPEIVGKSVFSSDTVHFKAIKGYASIVVFISSWCIPCQRLMPQIKQIEEHFSKLNAKFIYVFSNDTLEDARGFSNEYKILNNAIIANIDIQKAFHSPELPSIYIADRHGWLATRYLKMRDEDLQNLIAYLDRMTAF